MFPVSKLVGLNEDERTSSLAPKSCAGDRNRIFVALTLGLVIGIAV